MNSLCSIFLQTEEKEWHSWGRLSPPKPPMAYRSRLSFSIDFTYIRSLNMDEMNLSQRVKWAIQAKNL